MGIVSILSYFGQCIRLLLTRVGKEVVKRGDQKRGQKSAKKGGKMMKNGVKKVSQFLRG